MREHIWTLTPYCPAKGSKLCFHLCLSVCLSVCLYVCLLDHSESYKQILMIFWGVRCDPSTKWLESGGDLDRDPNPGIFKGYI